MRKNGSRLISPTQYRLSDWFMFVLILGLAELLSFCASTYWFPNDAYFILSFLTPIVLLLMVRWGWVSVIFAVAQGVLYCALRGYSWESYLAYAFGNAFVAFLLIPRYIFKGKVNKQIVSKWYFSFLFVLAGWFLMCFGRASISAMFGTNFGAALGAVCGLGDNGVLSLVIGEILVMVLRRLDGMWEDQKQYLLRLNEERNERMRRDSFGDEPVEIDDETVSILKRWDDGLDK